jgi:hypothetical protein
MSQKVTWGSQHPTNPSQVEVAKPSGSRWGSVMAAGEGSLGAQTMGGCSLFSESAD